MNSGKKIVIIAGPNGAGKTTFAIEYLLHEPTFPVFVNADLIVARLSSFQSGALDVRAGRVMLQEISNHAREGRSFAFETTLSGRGYVRRIKQWREDGYRIKLVFLSLATPEEAINRVKSRVAQGGHNIQEDVIRRRFIIGKNNFDIIYRHLVNHWQLINNSGTMPILIEKGENS